jgi:hypothetical protein
MFPYNIGGPRMSATPRRAMRIPAPLWEAARNKTEQNNTTVTAIVVAALEDYIREDAPND